ncbi:hypothetical protein A6E05_05665 [Aliivibrio sp. 1S165]|uniref:hypothetical protein n=1 Tax=unclassified Aliivibrio TaxID=2645654 RepID=UPI00080E52B8|nr:MULTISPECIES: hypothetical protein [unclassified Aliivibrio]OCH13794.1 hypothetical protein A6E05_05665 [Aliivibrio sp. 1S165]OCH31565.1 hypothetical protein A6E06_02775 [Aliivibrio sp. 1S175]
MNDHTITRFCLVFFSCCFSLGCYALAMNIGVSKDSDILGFLVIMFINGMMIKDLICNTAVLIPTKKTAIYTEKVKCNFRHQWKKEFDGKGIRYFSCKRCQARMVRQNRYSKAVIDWHWLIRKTEIIRINERSD